MIELVGAQFIAPSDLMNTLSDLTNAPSDLINASQDMGINKSAIDNKDEGAMNYAPTV